MKWKQYCAIVMIMICIFSSTSFVYGNSGPITVVEDTTFSMVPAGSTEIAVTEEALSFDFRKDGPYDVDVKAVYRMKNEASHDVLQKMMFPLITDPRSQLMESVKVLVDGDPVTFEALRLQDFQYNYTGNRLNDYISRTSALNMEHILNAWQQQTRDPIHFNMEDEVQVLTFSALSREERHEIIINYQLETGRSHIMTRGFTYHAWEGNGRGEVGKWIGDQESQGIEDDMFFFVWGSPLDLTKMTMTESVTYKTTTKQASDLLDQWVMMGMPDEPDSAKHAYKAHLAKKIDESLVPGPRHIELDNQILNPYFYETYLGAVLYEVGFQTGAEHEIVVEYTMRASQDRWETSRYSALVAYLLRPASGWKSFQNLSISIYPHPDQPYLLESSLTMEKDVDEGVYRGSFDTLPEENLVFRMYHRSKAETGLMKALSNPYLLLLIIPVVLVLAVLLVVSLVVMTALKKNRINLKD